jgi:Ohr subfamily peroxiredoxin
MKILYTAHATAVGGRDGHVETDDKHLVLELQGLDAAKKPGQTTNPEQLFACGYAACFGSAIEAVARKQNINAENISVTAHVTLMREDDGGFRLAAELDAQVPGLSADATRQLVEKAHQVCPYSKATRGNIQVELKAAA